MYQRFIVSFSFVAAFVFSVAAQAVTSEFEYQKYEGVYSINTEYVHPYGSKEVRIDRLVVFRNGRTNTYTVSLANSMIQLSLISFASVEADFSGENVVLRGIGRFDGRIAGEIVLSIDKESLEVQGSFIDAIADGVKLFNGTPEYNLSMCLYNPGEGFEFPPIEDLVGVYRERETGSDLILRRYTDGSISLVKVLYFKGSNNSYILHDPGDYIQELGLIVFPWVTSKGTSGKANVTYRIDENGEPYLKVFSVSTNGLNTIKKYYYHHDVLPLP